MSYHDIDDEIKKIIEKADRIVELEQLEKDRIETLTALREEDGRIKIALQQNKSKLTELKDNLQIAKEIWNTHSRYFRLLDQYSGEELQEVLHREIADYTWAEYSKIQDRLYKATNDKSEAELRKEIEVIEDNIDQLEQKRSDLVDNSILIIKELDARINSYKT